MIIKKIVIGVAAVALLVTACDVKDPITHMGSINVTSDWSKISTDITKPSSYTVGLDGRILHSTGERCEITDKLNPGSYFLYAYTFAENIAVNGTTATAKYTPGPLGWFFTSAQNVIVEADKVHEFNATMQQQVGQLTIEIEPTGGTTAKIKNITATLSGVAGSYNIGNNTYASAIDLPLTFIQAVDGKWKATVRLLGVAGATQKLTGTVKFTDGLPVDMPLESDLTSSLAKFNSQKQTPMTLSGAVVETLTESGFTAKITAWELREKGEVVVE